MPPGLGLLADRAAFRCVVVGRSVVGRKFALAGAGLLSEAAPQALSSGVWSDWGAVLRLLCALRLSLMMFPHGHESSGHGERRSVLEVDHLGV